MISAGCKERNSILCGWSHIRHVCIDCFLCISTIWIFSELINILHTNFCIEQQCGFTYTSPPIFALVLLDKSVL